MAKLEICANDIKQEIINLKVYRSGWTNDIREGYDFLDSAAKEILTTLCQTADTLIVALQSVLDGHYRDKIYIIMVKDRLEKLINSASFKYYAELGKNGICSTVTSGTCQHIRCMMDDLKVLTR